MERLKVRNARQERWLAEASEALLRAEMAVREADSAAAGTWPALPELRRRIGLLRREVERLQSLADSRRHEFRPEWMDLSAWS